MQNTPINGFAAQKVREFSIATRVGVKKVGKLSGGNQQKCLVGTWVGTDPSVIFLDEPTRGVDVASRAEIYAKIHELAGHGMAVVLIFRHRRADQPVRPDPRHASGAIVGEVDAKGSRRRR